MKEFVYRSILSGVFICIAAFVFLMVENPIIGSFFFSLGLLSIVAYRFNLFTGYVGYLPAVENPTTYYFQSFFVWFWNLIGTGIASFLLKHTTAYTLIQNRVSTMMVAKANTPFSSIMILGIFCGILMFTAVEAYKSPLIKNDVTKVVILILCVVVFINAKFEHSIANMAYAGLCSTTLNSVLLWKVIIASTLGNFIGCCTIPFLIEKNNLSINMK